MEETSKRESLASTYVVMFCTLGTRLLGFVREALVNALFGAGSEADVLRTVFRIPITCASFWRKGLCRRLSYRSFPDSSSRTNREITQKAHRRHPGAAADHRYSPDPPLYPVPRGGHQCPHTVRGQGADGTGGQASSLSYHLYLFRQHKRPPHGGAEFP